MCAASSFQVLHLAQLGIRGEGDLTRSHQLGLDVVQPGTASAPCAAHVAEISRDMAMDRMDIHPQFIGKSWCLRQILRQWKLLKAAQSS